MYAIVGCSSCSNLWLIEGRSKTVQCPRCGSRRPYEKRRKFLETDDPDHAREVRASMLASRQGESDAFARVDAFGDLEDTVEDGVIPDEEYLEAAGLDVDELAAAGDRNTRQPASQSKRAVVEEALETLESPTEADIVDYATDRGVEATYVQSALEKLVRRGAVSESRGTYRLL